MSETNEIQGSGFDTLGLSRTLLDAVAKAKFVEPTPIQTSAIPVALSGRDLVGLAQTGTGKTLAFALPIIEKIQQGARRALILAPTRELALQIEEHFAQVGKFLGIRTVVLIGGAPIRRQEAMLRKNPHVV